MNIGARRYPQLHHGCAFCLAGLAALEPRKRGERGFRGEIGTGRALGAFTCPAAEPSEQSWCADLCWHWGLSFPAHRAKAGMPLLWEWLGMCQAPKNKGRSSSPPPQPWLQGHGEGWRVLWCCQASTDGTCQSSVPCPPAWQEPCPGIVLQNSSAPRGSTA